MEDYCNEREKCMNKDPESENKSLKVLVRLFAELINDFFEPLSYKTITLMVLVMILIYLLKECFLNQYKHSRIYIRDEKDSKKMIKNWWDLNIIKIGIYYY